VSRRGRPAAQPLQDHHRPPLIVEQGLVVLHRNRQGRVVTYDFATLPVAVPFQRSLAALFAAKCAPGGGWDSLKTSDAAWWVIRPFAEFLSRYQGAPRDVEDMTAGLWNTWRLSLEPRPNGYNKYSTVAGLPQQDPRLPQAVREAMAKRFNWTSAGERAYEPDEFRTIRLAARRVNGHSVRF
jgi:hypothetical protein